MAPDERTGVLKTVKEQLKHLEPAQRKIADDNMRLLRERIEASAVEKAADPEQAIPEQEVVALRGELDALQSEVSPQAPDTVDPFAEDTDAREPVSSVAKPPAAPYEEPVATPQQAGATLESAQKETWFPRKADPREWTGKQIATVSALTLGLVGIYAWWKSRKHKDDRPSGGTDVPRKRSSLLYWIPGVGLGIAAFALLHNKLMQMDGYAKTYQKLIGEAHDMKQKAEDKIVSLTEGKGAPYGLSTEQYERAEQIYRRKGDASRPEIAAIFGLKPGESDEKYEKFMKEMEKNKAETINGIRYVPASVALRNYRENVGAVLFECEQWIESHKFRVAAGALLAARFGILQEIIHQSISTADKVRKLATAMLKFGMRHPIVSIFLLGGSVYGASKISDKVRLPENLSELSKAIRLQSQSTTPEASLQAPPTVTSSPAAAQQEPKPQAPVLLSLPSIAINPSGEPIPRSIPFATIFATWAKTFRLPTNFNLGSAVRLLISLENLIRRFPI